MSDSALEEYLQLIAKANEYHKKALWQEKLHILQRIQTICESGRLTDSARRTQDVLYDLGAIRRRLGQFQAAEDLLHRALEISPDSDPLKRASILGELSIVLRHASRYEEALEANKEQYNLARSANPCLEADVEQCRAIGNAGMFAYNISQRLQPNDPAVPQLLATAHAQLQERIDRARNLQSRLRADPESKWAAMARSWETIGMDRLTLVYIAQGHTMEALQLAEETQTKQTRVDPTVTASSRFFYGNALWHNGQRKGALEIWNAPSGTCNSPIALCKEPSQDNNDYIRLMASAGVDFDSIDEQGFSALDYAVLSDSSDAAESVLIILDALQQKFDQDISRGHPKYTAAKRRALSIEMVEICKRQAEVRKQYRNLLQESIRPKLQSSVNNASAKGQMIKQLRELYRDFLSSIPEHQQTLWPFHYVSYADFKSHGRLPSYSDGLARIDVAAKSSDLSKGLEDVFIVFFSYRWRGGVVPDDTCDTQWHRMVNAIELFLQMNTNLSSDQIAIWLDYACIDQDDLAKRLCGVDAMPIAVMLCDAMISLVDDQYYDRAWCGVEIMLIDALAKSYGIHCRWEHLEQASGTSLQAVSTGPILPIDGLKLTKEEEDRPKIDFLMRQRELMVRDLAL